jgi:hypothetical protein
LLGAQSRIENEVVPAPKSIIEAEKKSQDLDL